jgi:hypothetical protein
MARDRYHDDERLLRADFAVRHAGPDYKEWMQYLYEQWRRSNAAYFDGRLLPPHIDIGRTAPRSLGHCHATTGYGAPLHAQPLIFRCRRLTLLTKPPVQPTN